MNRAQNTAQILDFAAYRQSREPVAPDYSGVVAPFYFWYPVWLFIPQFASPESGISTYGASGSVAEI